MRRTEAERTLRLISKAWGRRQEGYCFFPWIDREAQVRTGSRRAGYHEGPEFYWPRDREKIVDHMLEHQNHDLYWCPSLFEYPVRRTDVAMDEHALWADLDEADPRLIEDYPPTIAWESSPGRYQALWIAASGDFQGASWPGNENQRLTYHLNADASGWDTTQLLRVPGWVNHKPDYKKKYGEYPKGKILWTDGPQYHPGDFADLPEVRGAVVTDITDALEQEIDNVDRHKVIARVQLKLTHRAREMLKAREVSGDRSSQLWYLIRCLADVGCSVAEIVAIVRETVWNKFSDRADEVRVLITEASKAIAQRSDETLEKLEQDDEEERAAPQRLGFLLANIKRPVYLIEGVLTEGVCGFIAGEPKCYKSWVGLDMALSVASGADFLGQFPVVNPGPVLYIQEEDPPTVLKSRSAKIWAGKAVDKFQLVPSEGMPEIEWLPPEAEATFDPDINALVQKGVTLSDPAWQLYLDEVLAEGMDGEAYRLMVIDTLMMTAGEVEENKSQEMTQKIYKPLKVLARKYNVAIQVVHHMGKADRPRAGQRMLGAVANHAWSEDSLYLARAGASDIRMESESKTAPGGVWRITNLANKSWEPHVAPWKQEDSTPSEGAANGRLRGGSSSGRRSNRSSQGSARNDRRSKAEQWVDEQGKEVTNAEVAEATGLSKAQVWRQLRRAEEQGRIRRVGTNDQGATIWAPTE